MESHYFSLEQRQVNLERTDSFAPIHQIVSRGYLVRMDSNKPLKVNPVQQQWVKRNFTVYIDVTLPSERLQLVFT